MNSCYTRERGGCVSYVEGDDNAGRVVGGELDGHAEEAVKEQVLRREPGAWDEEPAGGVSTRRAINQSVGIP
jgi:hypothetical protein